MSATFLVVCTKCKNPKESGCFYKDRGHSNGLATRCKECVQLAKKTPEARAKVAAMARKRYHRDIQQARLKARRYQKKYRDEATEEQRVKRKKYSKEYAAKNRANLNAYKAAVRGVRGYDAKYFSKNYERKYGSSRIWNNFYHKIFPSLDEPNRYGRTMLDYFHADVNDPLEGIIALEKEGVFNALQ